MSTYIAGTARSSSAAVPIKDAKQEPVRVHCVLCLQHCKKLSVSDFNTIADTEACAGSQRQCSHNMAHQRFPGFAKMWGRQDEVRTSLLRRAPLIVTWT